VFLPNSFILPCCFDITDIKAAYMMLINIISDAVVITDCLRVILFNISLKVLPLDNLDCESYHRIIIRGYLNYYYSLLVLISFASMEISWFYLFHQVLYVKMATRWKHTQAKLNRQYQGFWQTSNLLQIAVNISCFTD